MIRETETNNQQNIILRIKQNYLNAAANLKSLQATYNASNLITEHNQEQYFNKNLYQRELFYGQGLLRITQMAYMEACIKDCDAKQIETNFTKRNHSNLQGLKQNYEDAISNHNAIVEKNGQYNAIRTVETPNRVRCLLGIKLVPSYTYHQERYFDTAKYEKSLDYAKTIEARTRMIYESFDPESCNIITERTEIYRANLAKEKEDRAKEREIAYAKEKIMDADDAIASNPKYSEAYNKKGQALITLGRFKEAITEFDYAISLDSSSLEFFHNKGNALEALGLFEDALEEYNKGIAVELNNYKLAKTFNKKRDILNSLQKFEEAKEIDEEHNNIKKIQYYSNDIVFANKKHYTGRELSNLEKIISACDRIIDKNIYYINAYNAKGNILKILGRFEESISAYDMAITKNPNNALYYLNKAKILEQLGREEEALDTWNKGYEICKLLIPEEACSNFISQNGWSILAMAAQSDNIKMCESLIIEGANVNSRGKNGWTPFNIAIESANIKICKLLIEAGADVNLSSYGPLRALPDDSRKELIQIKKNVDNSHGLFSDSLKTGDFSTFLNQPISLITRYLSYKKYFDENGKIFPSMKIFKSFLEQYFDENGNHIQSYNTKFSSVFFALPREIFEGEIVIHNKGYDKHFLNDFYCSRLKSQVLCRWDTHLVFSIKELMGLISSYLSPNDILDPDDQIATCMVGACEINQDSEF